jgi:hypothetical protein
MQRGRGRGRNSNPSRSTSRRGTSARGSRSNSRTTISRTTSRTDLRRSARLAQLLNGEVNEDVNGLTNGLTNGAHHHPATNSSMADVARSRPLGNGSRRHVSSRTQGRQRSGHSSASPEGISYVMDILVQPPSTAWAGHNIGGIIIVRLRITDDHLDDAITDSSNLVAVATLVRDNNWPGSRDPNVLNNILTGRRYDSVQPFSDDEADGSISSMEMSHPRGVGYMRFPELVIRQAGTYRIRITLIRIRNSNSDAPAPSASGSTSVHIVDSNPITVSGAGQSSPLASYNGKYYMAATC